MIHHFSVKRLRTAFCLAMMVTVTACGGGGGGGDSDGSATPSNNDKNLSTGINGDQSNSSAKDSGGAVYLY